MENYIVSARKYRPSTFESVVGQENLTRTLRNAIVTHHLAQAYLFCGPRGVGKTTCARIFAKTINCLNPTDNSEACNECESCKAFNEQRSFNIHELDAASNNSVENIRQLIEQVRIPPQIGKYSVFIIDEVHMLSKDAFNALLKTLEEPPSYAIFILATTEKNKVIPTILSRCQVYDFSRITVKDTIHHLQYVAKQEGVEVSEESLNVVAQKADGGMRDALSIFDQLVSFCGKTISYEQTIDILNVLATDYYFQLVSLALQNKAGEALLLFNEILNKGFDALNFVVGLGQHLRNVLVSKNPETVVLLETSESIQQTYIEQAKQCPIAFLFKALEEANRCDVNYRQSKNKRLTVELMLIKLCQITLPVSTEPNVPIQPVKPVATSTAPVSKPVAQPVATASNPLQRPIPTASKPATAPLPKQISILRTSSAPASKQEAEKDEPKEPKDDPVPAASTDFTEEEFEQVWLTLPRAFEQEDRLKAILINAKVQVQNKTQVCLILANQLQQEVIMPWMDKITSLLRTRLHNNQIALQTLVKVVARKPTHTVVEQFQLMAQRNPELAHLVQALNLQIE